MAFAKLTFQFQLIVQWANVNPALGLQYKLEFKSKGTKL